MTERKVRKLMRSKSPQQIESSEVPELSAWLWAWWEESSVEGDYIPALHCVHPQSFVVLRQGVLGFESMLRYYRNLELAFGDLIQAARSVRWL